MYEAGRAMTTEVLDREMQLVRASKEVVEARVDRRVAVERLRRVVGRSVTA